MRRILPLVAVIALLSSSVSADVKPPRGFDNQVYKASMALYGTLPKGTVLIDEDGTTIVPGVSPRSGLLDLAAFRPPY